MFFAGSFWATCGRLSKLHTRQLPYFMTPEKALPSDHLFLWILAGGNTCIVLAGMLKHAPLALVAVPGLSRTFPKGMGAVVAFLIKETAEMDTCHASD